MLPLGRPIRVALISASLDLGGSERQMVNLAARLPRDRFAVEFVLLVQAGPLADEAAAAGIPVHVLGWHRGDVPWRRVRRLGDVGRFVRVMRARRFDVVDAWLFHAYALAAVTKDLTGTPTLIAGRRSLSDFKAGFSVFNGTLDRIAARRASEIVANGEAVRQDVARREGIPDGRIRVIRNGIVPQGPLSPEDRRRLRSSWGATGTEVVVGCVANYKGGKGLDQVVEVADRLRHTVPTLRFVLVGEGPLRSALESDIHGRGLRDRVILHGHERDARRLYGAFDLTVQASGSEGLPNAVLEAAAAGLPVVATAAGGTGEIVIHGETGFLVSIGDPTEMAMRVASLASEPGIRAAMGAAGRRHVETSFGMDRFVAETAALYEHVVRGKDRPS